MRTTLLISLCVWVGGASAQVVRDRLEKAGDRREQRDDRRDAAILEGLLARFDAARAKNDLAALATIEQTLKAQVERELVESRVELVKDGRELRQDKRELGSDRREVRKDRALGKPIALADDKADLRDDRRDLRDDRRDAIVELGTLARVKAINAELTGMLGKTDPASLDRKRALMVEMIGLGWHELGQDRRELREDKRELREDRRELREDLKHP